MRAMTTNELRHAYLDFFREKHGHAVIPGASLVPENDPTVLFTTAGMHPLVPYLLGETHPAGKRLVDVQRCVRTQDIDEVGDSCHLTMFEMLGNWSLGDYFKDGAIAMSVAFLTEVLQIPVAKIAITCFVGDSDAPRDEASAAIWRRMGIAAERIGFLPKAKNWWGPAGKTGPCGPDTEMFYWIGSTDLPPLRSNPENDEAHWLEIWNDVFMEFNKTEGGTFEPLRQKNVDTGMGLERVAAVLQGVQSVYEIDGMKSIMETIEQIASVKFLSESTYDDRDSSVNQKAQKFSLKHGRIICDHLKAAVFIIADGVHPANVDRGYVLRRLIRRAIRSGRKLGISERLAERVAREVITQYGGAYPHLLDRKTDVLQALEKEEMQFRRTLEEGLKHYRKTSGPIDGAAAFHLYDTYGFPLELTVEMAAEEGRAVDADGFRAAFLQHQEKSRAGAQKRFAGGLADHGNETTKLHTATHLLNAALRRVLGPHVEQKGSNVTAQRLRFDFTHPTKMTTEQIAEVAALVNDAIVADLPVSYHVTDVAGAKAEGAVGVFDARYGADVKVYVIGDGAARVAGSGKVGDGPVFSKEICGGPHVAHTGLLGTFAIQKEEAVSAGVRRIKATVHSGPTMIETATEQS